MLLIVGILILLIAAVIISSLRVAAGASANDLGWMSQRWLAEHRASHSA